MEVWGDNLSLILGQKGMLLPQGFRLLLVETKNKQRMTTFIKAKLKKSND